MKKLITIIDYGINNIRSVVQALQYIGVEIKIANKPSELENSKHIIIPGVGAFPVGMKKLKNLGLDEMILTKAKQKSNILGICLGMQMLFTKGYEYGECNGLNLIPGEVLQIPKKMNNEKKLPVIGWRKTTSSLLFKENILEKKLNENFFYYLHSYQAIPEKKNNIIAYYERGGSRINAAVAHGNIWGVQFHPEKSGDAGLEFLKGFCNLNINN
jgi:glutamine amidotransferase|tara:strand:- start:21 stop:662 length:642 start_codon:yes stop_codon:yes gene_type:complete